MKIITLKIAEKEEAPILCGLLKNLARDLGKENEFSGSAEAIEKFGFSSSPAFEAIIAWQGETAVGFILFFYEFSTWRGQPGVYVQDLFVASQARGLGLGERLTYAAVERAKERGVTYMRLAVHNGNEGGFGFYKAMGFEAVTDETTLLLEGEAFDKK